MKDGLNEVTAADKLEEFRQLSLFLEDDNVVIIMPLCFDQGAARLCVAKFPNHFFVWPKRSYHPL